MYKINKYYLRRIETNKIFRRAFSAGDFGIWEWNINTDEVFLSENFKKISEYDSNFTKNMVEFISNIVYEEDKILAINDLNEHICGISAFYQSTFRIKSKNGDIKWVLFRGKIFKNRLKKESLFSGVMSDITNNKLLEGCDSLTKLPNRNFFLQKLNNSLKTAISQYKKGALIYIDIDNLKIINDNLGHQIGDLIMIQFSKSISIILSGRGELGRLGGDEFAVLIHEFNDMKTIKEICSDIHESLKQPFKIMNNHIYVTASLGISVFPDDSSDTNELLKFCDFAMYKSKYMGKNMSTFFDKQMSEHYFRKILIESELKNSIINNEFKIFYQPQIDALTDKIIGIEALLRWDNAKLGKVSPNEFIPIAENTEFIVEIGEWVLDRVLKLAYTWKEKGYEFNTISVNISPIQIKKVNFKETLLNDCAKHNIPPCLLEMEITEGTLIEICKEKIKVLNELSKSGVNIAIDDFGTGYSSLNYLINFPVSTVKIDKTFIDNIENKKNIALIRSLTDLSKSFEYKIIAEGVETKEQMDLLISLGCNLIQGYYLSKPLPENEFEELLKNQNLNV